MNVQQKLYLSRLSDILIAACLTVAGNWLIKSNKYKYVGTHSKAPSSDSLRQVLYLSSAYQ